MSKYDNFQTVEDFQKFVDENNIESPKDFKKANGTLYSLLSKLRLCKYITYKHRINDYSDYNTVEDFQKFVDENNIESPKMFERKFCGLCIRARKLKLMKLLQFKYRLNDYSNYNTIEDFQKFIDENNIETPKQFQNANQSLYGRLLRLKLAKQIKYKDRRISYKEISSKEDFQKYIDENNILSTNDFRLQHNSLYQKALKRGFYKELYFQNSHFWRNHQEYQTMEDFQKFIDENKILSPTDFKCIDSPLYRKACKMGFANLLRYDKRNFSKSELNILKMLTDNEIEYVLQQKFEWLKSSKGYYLSLDFYLPKYNIAIECQGKQHFVPNDYFGGKARYLDEVKRNKLKHQLCEENGVNILYYVDLTLDDYTSIDFKNYLGEVFFNVESILKLIKNED